MTYKDRAWCCESEHCGNALCYRNLTDDESRKADGWAKDLPYTPVAFANLRTDDCGYVPIERRDDDASI